jgi:hypothetical protein
MSVTRRSHLCALPPPPSFPERYVDVCLVEVDCVHVDSNYAGSLSEAWFTLGLNGEVYLPVFAAT